jgi:hypothetical protein
MYRLRTLATIASTMCVAASLGLVPSADAALIDSGAEIEPIDFVDPNFCDVSGLVVHGTGSSEVRWTAHPQGPDGIAYFVNQISTSIRLTNVTGGVDGAYVESTERTIDKDQKIVVGEDNLTITGLATGMFKVTDAGGRLIAANPGQIRYQVVIDHNGTPANPFDDTFIEDLGLVKQSTGRNDDFCENVVPALMG